MNNNNKTKDFEDGLNFFQLCSDIWSGKWIIFLTTIVFFCIGFYYSRTLTVYYNGDLEIRNIDSENYLSINSLQLTKQQGDRVVYVELPKVTSDILSELFMYNAVSYEDLRESIKNNSEQVLSFKGSEADKISLINSIAKNYSFEYDTELETNFLRFSTDDVRESELIINNALIGINDKIRNTVLEKFNLFKNTLIIDQKKQEYELTKQYKNILLEYELKNSKRLTFLNNQFNIAEELGIKTNKIKKFKRALIAQVEEYINYYNDNPDKEFPQELPAYFWEETWQTKYAISLPSSIKEDQLPLDNQKLHYLSGSNELLVEINELNKIGKIDFTSISDIELKKILPDLVRVRNDLNNLDNSFTINLIDEAVRLSPLVSPNFASVMYDTSLISYNSLTKEKAQRVIFISILLGIVISTCYILFRIGYRRHLLEN